MKLLNKIQFIFDIIVLVGICFCISATGAGYTLVPQVQTIFLIALGLFIAKQAFHDYKEL